MTLSLIHAFGRYVSRVLHQRHVVGFLLCMVILLKSELNAQWVQTEGPYGGYVFSLTNSLRTAGAPTLYAGGFGSGVYRSTDFGTTWENRSTGITDKAIISVVSAGDTILAGTRAGGMFRSTNGGSAWSPVTNGLFPGDIIPAIVVTFTVSGNAIFFAAVAGVGVHRSDDGGHSWAPTSSPQCLTVSTLLAVDWGSPSLPLLVGSFPDGIYISDDLGQSWEQASTGLGDLNIWSLASHADTAGSIILFAGTNDHGVYRSTDAGSHWQLTSLNKQTRGLTSVRSAAGVEHLFAGTATDGIYRSTNHGGTWAQANTGMPYNDIRAFTILDTAVFAAPVGGGVYRSTDFGGQWVPAAHGIRNLEVRSFVVGPGTLLSHLYAGSWGGGVFSSTNAGATWSEVHNGLSNKYVLSLAFQGSHLFAGTWGLGGIFRSTDGGSSWTLSGLSGNAVFSLAVLGQYLFAGTGSDSGVFRSGDLGLTWRTMNTGLSSLNIGGMAVHDTVLFAGALGGAQGIYRSTDFGETWTGHGPVDQDVVAFLSHAGNLYAATYRIGSGILRSSDDGLTWTTANVGLTSRQIQSLCGVSGHIFAGTRDAGIFWSSNNGDTWTQVNSGLTTDDVKAVFWHNNYLFAGTGFDGVWKRPLHEIITSIIGDVKHHPGDFHLAQNYPNPFNPSTTIRYTLPSKGGVRLRIYNSLGQVIRTLIDEEQESGEHAVVWDGRNDFGLPTSSGAYLYRLEAGGLALINKMILLQ